MYLYIKTHTVDGDSLVYLSAVVPAMNSLSQYDNAPAADKWIKIDLSSASSSSTDISEQLKIYHRIRNNITDIIIEGYNSDANETPAVTKLKKKGSDSNVNVTNDVSLDDVRTVERSPTFKDAVPRLTIPQGMFSL